MIAEDGSFGAAMDKILSRGGRSGLAATGWAGGPRRRPVTPPEPPAQA
jgi:hypothetical protein